MERGTCPSPASHTSLIGVRGSEPPNRLCQGEDCINSPKSQDPRTALLNTVQQPQCSQGRCMDSWARGRVSTYQSLLQSVALRAATSRPGCRSPQPKAVRPGVQHSQPALYTWRTSPDPDLSTAVCGWAKGLLGTPRSGHLCHWLASCPPRSATALSSP